jgi:hypothetical protein
VGDAAASDDVVAVVVVVGDAATDDVVAAVDDAAVADVAMDDAADVAMTDTAMAAVHDAAAGRAGNGGPDRGCGCFGDAAVKSATTSTMCCLNAAMKPVGITPPDFPLASPQQGWWPA